MVGGLVSRGQFGVSALLVLGCALLALAISFVVVSAADAAMVSFGPNLSTGPAPTLDTANGATEAHFEEPLSVYESIHGTSGKSTADTGIVTSFGARCLHTYSPDVANYPCTSAMHSGADNTIWNTGAGAGAPQGGQALEVDVKGCTVEDNSPSNNQQSPTGGGGYLPANTIQFQSLASQADGSYTVDATAGTYQLPWCSNSASPADPAAAVNTSTITAFHPVHLCLKPGNIVSFYDLGGSVPNPPPPAPIKDLFYPQGAPFMVIAQVPGVSTDSFTDANAAPPTPGAGSVSMYGPGSMPLGDNSGWGQESGQQVMLSVVEGVGDDAYGLCPGGRANETATSNAVVCVYHQTAPGDPYPSCDGAGNPFRPPVNTSPPTISGTAQIGSTLTENHGAWSNSPASYNVQWERCDSTGASCQPISGATSNSYKVAAGDAGHTLRVQESATNPANTEGPVSSAPTAAITTPAPPPVPLVVGKLRLTKYAFLASQGTTISYQDSVAGMSTLTVSGSFSGKDSGKECVPPTHKLRRAKSCTYSKVLYTFTHADTAGLNSVPFLDKHLAKGVYTLRATTTFSGQPTVTNSLTMRIVSPPRHSTRH